MIERNTRRLPGVSGGRLQWQIRALLMETGAEIHQGSLAAFQVIEKRADWNTGTDKHQAAAQDIGVSVRNIGKYGHGSSPYSAISISPVGSSTYVFGNYGASSESMPPPQSSAAIFGAISSRFPRLAG
jgi:hypothetical protein